MSFTNHFPVRSRLPKNNRRTGENVTRPQTVEAQREETREKAVEEENPEQLEPEYVDEVYPPIAAEMPNPWDEEESQPEEAVDEKRVKADEKAHKSPPDDIAPTESKAPPQPKTPAPASAPKPVNYFGPVKQNGTHSPPRRNPSPRQPIPGVIPPRRQPVPRRNRARPIKVNPLGEVGTRPGKQRSAPTANKQLNNPVIRTNRLGVVPTPAKPGAAPPVAAPSSPQKEPAAQEPEKTALPHTPEPKVKTQAQTVVPKPLTPRKQSAQPPVAKTRPKLAEVIQKNQPLPAHAVLLGVCDDGLPLLLDLFDPSPGSVLIVSDDAEANRAHLQAVLDSALILNTSKQVEINLMAPKPQAFRGTEAPHYKDLLLAYEAKVFDLLGDTFELAEKRLKTKDKTPVRLMVIDQLDVLAAQLDDQSLSFLRWLLRRGPASHVWTIATLSTDKAAALNMGTIRAFSLRLVGRIQNAKHAAYAGSLLQSRVAALKPGEEACVKLGDDIIQFDIPVAEEKTRGERK